MCLIAFAKNVHPSYPLVLIANRDEFYSRPTRPAQFWDHENIPHLLAGKDLDGGGTWMGVTKSGFWAALTNYRDPNWKRENPPTRGNIVLGYLKSEIEPKTYLNWLQDHANDYMGFNTLIAEGTEVYHYSNVNNVITTIGDGVHGVSNALLDTSWPKLERAKSALQKHLNNENIDKDVLFRILADPTTAIDDDLPETGIPYKWEKAVSSIFINTESYGTRCSSVLLIQKSGAIKFFERRFRPSSQIVSGEQSYHISGK